MTFLSILKCYSNWMEWEDDMDVQVFMDYVLIGEVRIDRPARIARSRWMRLWHHVASRITSM